MINYSEANQLEKYENVKPQRFLTWLERDAIPFWMANGIDHQRGGVFEWLNFDGSPVTYAPRRLRVLARQIYCFSVGKLNFQIHANTENILQHCLQSLKVQSRRSDGGFVHTFNGNMAVKDSRADTYDHCFILLAMAHLWRATGWQEAQDIATETLQYMDQMLYDNSTKSYFEDSIHSVPRRANPHMHLLEALLAWYEASGDSEFLERAGDIVTLFNDVFFDEKTQTLREFFDYNWKFRSTDSDVFVEPGHHYEWSWLLMRYCGLTNDHETRQRAHILFEFARAKGHYKQTGAARDYIMPNGDDAPFSVSQKPRDQSRCWPQTEALKAALIFKEDGHQKAKDFIVACEDVLFKHYLNVDQVGGVPGTWIDVIDREGAICSTAVPASTFYHLVSAGVELQKYGA